jgi:hypothetical protein
MKIFIEVLTNMAESDKNARPLNFFKITDSLGSYIKTLFKKGGINIYESTR